MSYGRRKGGLKSAPKRRSQAISPLLAEQMLSKDGRAAIIRIEQDPTVNGASNSLAEFLHAALASENDAHPFKGRLRAEQTGYGAFARDGPSRPRRSSNSTQFP